MKLTCGFSQDNGFQTTYEELKQKLQEYTPDDIIFRFQTTYEELKL